MWESTRLKALPDVAPGVAPAVGVVANRTVVGSGTGVLNATSTRTASGSRFSTAATHRALLHMPWAICRGKPRALAVNA